MNPRIIPLNLPAGLEREIPGNPVTTRLESAIGNCYPGLEVDARNLDRRFFPGLIFEFVAFDDNDPAVAGRGARLVAVDLSDPDLPDDPGVRKRLARLSNMLSVGSMYLQALTVQGEQRIELIGADGLPFDWDVTWRIVRSIPAKPVTIELSARLGAGPLLAFTAPRRVFQDKHGELSKAYPPGEMSQSLCSPWQHDFRDCGCTYWASNHPDIVLPAHPADIGEVQDSGPSAEKAEDPIIWMRWDQPRDVPARAIRESSAPFEIDHYEMNERWRDLAIVLGGREYRVPWSIGPAERVAPLDPKQLYSELRRLAGVEHALALEYLYARYSVRFEDEELKAEDQKRADFIAHELLVIATSEMAHLRWVNQLLWELAPAMNRRHEPALGVASKVPEEVRRPGSGVGGAPTRIRWRKPKMRSLDKAIDDFVAAESPSGGIEGQYAHLLALLRQGLPAGGADSADEHRGRREVSPDLIGLAERIIADGVTHYSRFREIKALLDRSGGRILRNLRNLRNGERVLVVSPQGATMRVTYAYFARLYREMIRNLQAAYATGRAEDRRFIIQARQAMTDMDGVATQLARRGRGVPFLDIAREVIPSKTSKGEHA